MVGMAALLLCKIIVEMYGIPEDSVVAKEYMVVRNVVLKFLIDY
jgi:hypothetical protein